MPAHGEVRRRRDGAAAAWFCGGWRQMQATRRRQRGRDEGAAADGRGRDGGEEADGAPAWFSSPARRSAGLALEARRCGSEGIRRDAGV